MDIFDQEIERLTKLVQKSPQDECWILETAWSYGKDHSPLFDSCAGPGNTCVPCLTQVRSSYSTQKRTGYPSLNGFDPTIAAEIAADKRLPGRQDVIKLHHLPVFAEWQRKLAERRLQTQ